MSQKPKHPEDRSLRAPESSGQSTPFEAIRRTNPAGNEFWSSRDFAKVLGYVNYRHFQAVIEKARSACSNSGQREEDHFVGSDQLIEIGKGGQRSVQTVLMSRYACYLVIQNADPAKEIVAQGQTYFAIQTRRQELSDAEVEEQRRLPSAPSCGRTTANWPTPRRMPELSSPAITPSFKTTATWASTAASARRISTAARA